MHKNFQCVSSAIEILTYVLYATSIHLLFIFDGIRVGDAYVSCKRFSAITLAFQPLVCALCVQSRAAHPLAIRRVWRPAPHRSAAPSRIRPT